MLWFWAIFPSPFVHYIVPSEAVTTVPVIFFPASSVIYFAPSCVSTIELVNTVPDGLVNVPSAFSEAFVTTVLSGAETVVSGTVGLSVSGAGSGLPGTGSGSPGAGSGVAVSGAVVPALPVLEPPDEPLEELPEPQ